MSNALKRQETLEVSVLEETYRELFQQVTPDDTTPLVNDNVMRVPARDPRLIIRTYTTYGAYEEPIAKY